MIASLGMRLSKSLKIKFAQAAWRTHATEYRDRETRKVPVILDRVVDTHGRTPLDAS